MLAIRHDWRGAPLHRDEQVAFTLTLDDHRLDVEVEAPFHDDPRPLAPPGSTDRLWEHEVVEVFLLGQGDHYYELELGPHGHFVALRLKGARNVVEMHLPVAYEAHIEGTRWRGHARVPRLHVPTPLMAANAYAMHGVGNARRHLACHPVPGAAPDFHRLERFRPLVWRSIEG